MYRFGNFLFPIWISLLSSTSFSKIITSTFDVENYLYSTMWMKFIGTLIIDHDIVRTTSLFSKNCNSPVTFLCPSHSLVGIRNHIAASSKYFSGSCVPQGSEDFPAGNSLVTPLSGKTAQVCWQYPNYFPGMLKEARKNSFDMHPSSF